MSFLGVFGITCKTFHSIIAETNFLCTEKKHLISVVMNSSMALRNPVVKMVINQMNVQCWKKKIIFGILPHGKLGMSHHVTGDPVAANYTNYATVPGEFSCCM